MNLTPLVDQFLLWALILLRIASALAVMPVFGYRGVPAAVKVGLAVFVSFLLLPVVQAPPHGEMVGAGLLTFLALALPEIAAGLVIGVVTHFIFYGVQLSGQYLGIQVGFAIANVIDPQTEQQISIIAQVQFIFAMLIFLIFNGHHFLLLGLQQTFAVVPVGGAVFPAGLAEMFVKLMGGLFAAGIKIAAPVMAALFLSEVALGIVARTVPQMNVFIVGFPLKIGVGLLALALSWPMFVYVLELLWKNFQGDWLRFINLLAP